METKLGKISHVKFGNGGYQNAMFGLSLGFDMKGSGCGTFVGAWPLTMKRPKQAEWTEKDREDEIVSTVKLITEAMKKAKVEEIHELEGVPVELTFEGMKLDSWRILEEVL